MAMCKVLSHIGAGLYSVEVYMDDGSIQKRIDKLVGEIARLDLSLSSFSVSLVNAKALVDSYISELNALISDLNNQLSLGNDASAIRQEITKTTAEGLRARNAYIANKALYNQLQADKAARLSEKNNLSNRQTLTAAVLEVWCVDLADGIDGRAIYSVNDETEIWCLNYDAGDYGSAKYLLPPKNTNIPVIPNAHINVPRNYPILTAACMTFVNSALEPGFAKWSPIFLSGVVTGLRGDSDKDCDDVSDSKDASQDTLLIKLSSIVTRHGGIKLGGATTSFPVDYFDGKRAFNNDDKVVVAVQSVSEQGYINGIIVGFYSNPQVYESSDSTCPDLSNLKVNMSETLFDDVGMGVIGDVTSPIMQGGWLFYTAYWPFSDVFISEESKLTIYGYSAALQDPIDPTAPYLFGSCKLPIEYHASELVNTTSWLDDVYIEDTTDHSTYYTIGGVAIPAKRGFYHKVIEGGVYTHYQNYSETLTQIHSICVPTGAYSYTKEILNKTLQYNIGYSMYYTLYFKRVKYTVDCNGLASEEVLLESTGTSSKPLYPEYKFHSSYDNQYHDADYGEADLSNASHKMYKFLSNTTC